MRKVLLWSSGISLFISVVCALVVERFLDERIAIFGSFAGLQKSHNPGIAFGIELPGGFQEVLIALALIIVWRLAWKTAKSKLSAIGFGLIIGGGLGNIVDRFPDGLVTDMVQVGTFPIFNVADSCITVGAALLLLEALFGPKGNQ